MTGDRNMKRFFALVIAAVMLLALCACGTAKAPETKNIDLIALYESFCSVMPDMFTMDDTTRLNFLGVDAADCAQVITATCVNGLLADEVWLIEAKDAAALEKLEKLAQSRIDAKLFETESYAPDQHLIVKEAELVVNGMYLALIISPDVATLKQILDEAMN